MTSLWNPGTDSLPVNTNNTLKTQSFTAAQDQEVFTLTEFSYVPGTNSLLVSYNGDLQIVLVDFLEIDSTTIKLNFKANAGDSLQLFGFVGISGQVNNPSLFQYKSTAAAGQTVFPLPYSYAPGVNMTAVYSNGYRLYSGTDYQETDSFTITLTTPASVGDKLLFVLGSYITPSGIDSSNVSYRPAGVSAVYTNVQSKLSEILSARDFVTTADGTVDNTVEFQRACDASANNSLLVPPGVYYIGSIGLSYDITIYALPGAIFKRKAGLDIRQSDWNVGTAMFEILADGKTVHFVGNPTFDGNKQNQPVTSINPGMAGATTEPSGWSIKYQPVNPATAGDCRILVENGVFKNGTTGYVLVRGDDVNRRFKTVVTLINPVMTDTIRGYGAGDPATPTPLGWNSDYIRVVDYVELNTHDIDLSWSQYPTATGVYAPVGIRATFYGQLYANSGNARLNLYGRTKLRGLGRKSELYDGSASIGNNGIGATDCYGNAESCFIEDMYAVDCELIPMRAKGSIERYVVLNAYLKNCKQGLEIGPSSTGPCQADVYIGNFQAEGGYEPQITVSGTSAVDTLKSVKMGNVVISGTTNGLTLADSSAGVIRARFIDDLQADSLIVNGGATRSLNILNNNKVSIDYTSITNSGSYGVALMDNVKSVHIGSGSVMTAVSQCVYAQGSTEKISIDNFRADGGVNYGFYMNTSAAATDIKLNGVQVTNISGSSRGVYFANHGNISQSFAGAGVTTPLMAADNSKVYEWNNSWNRKRKEGTAAPATGTWAQGDTVENTAAAASGPAGWVCVVGGTPGTWKVSSVISA